MVGTRILGGMGARRGESVEKRVSINSSSESSRLALNVATIGSMHSQCGVTDVAAPVESFNFVSAEACEEDVKSDESSVEFRQLSNDSNRNVLESSNDTTGLNTSGEVGFASFESSPKLLPIDKDVNSDTTSESPRHDSDEAATAPLTSSKKGSNSRRGRRSRNGSCRRSYKENCRPSRDKPANTGGRVGGPRFGV